MTGPHPSRPLSNTNRDRTRPRGTLADRVKGRVRIFAVRHRLGRWAAAGGAGLVALWALAGALADANAARAGWGESVDVVVARATIEPGEAIEAAMIGMESLPARMVPTDAISEPPLGARVTAEVGPGEILVAHRVTRREGSTASVALPDGTRGVTLHRDQVFGEIGDAVDLHAIVSGEHLATAVVVDTDEARATVAVPRADVQAVVDAISQGGLVSVLVP